MDSLPFRQLGFGHLAVRIPWAVGTTDASTPPTALRQLGLLCLLPFSALLPRWRDFFTARHAIAALAVDFLNVLAGRELGLSTLGAHRVAAFGRTADAGDHGQRLAA